jgi:hypothetical protein
MKESSRHNPKMATYYQEVHKLEDKFNGLELNHIPGGLMKQPTNWQRWCLAKNRSWLMSLPAISASPQSVMRS